MAKTKRQVALEATEGLWEQISCFRDMMNKMPRGTYERELLEEDLLEAYQKLLKFAELHGDDVLYHRILKDMGTGSKEVRHGSEG